MSRYLALIPAAGVGARMNAAVPKQYLPLAGKPMLQHVVETFKAIPAIEHTFVVVSAADGYIDSLDLPATGVTVLRCGGATRHESVRNGLDALRGQCNADDWVLVHDAARPGLSAQLVHRLISALEHDPVGGLLAMPVVDTMKRATTGRRVSAPVARDALWAAQTPQMFRAGLLRKALANAHGVTDESGAVEALGLQPLLVEGSSRNLKVTGPEDMQLMEVFLGMPQ